MEKQFSDIDILFVAGFGPITRDTQESKLLYIDCLGLPLKRLENDYFLTEENGLQGVKHFALWPLNQAAQSCFGSDQWPAHLDIPQAWIEFEVQDMITATQMLKTRNYKLLIENKEEPWGQTVTRFLSPEGLLTGVTVTPWLRAEKHQ